MKTKLMLVSLILAGILLGCTVTDDGFLIIRTADPNQSLAIKVLQPPLLPTTTPGPQMSPECLIKVNWSGSEWIYHIPGQVSYERTIIDPSKNEFFACSESEALEAGARKALR